MDNLSVLKKVILQNYSPLVVIANFDAGDGAIYVQMPRFAAKR